MFTSQRVTKRKLIIWCHAVDKLLDSDKEEYKTWIVIRANLITLLLDNWFYLLIIVIVSINSSANDYIAEYLEE